MRLLHSKQCFQVSVQLLVLRSSSSQEDLPTQLQTHSPRLETMILPKHLHLGCGKLSQDSSAAETNVLAEMFLRWMIIPHVAIISSLLLADNNPSTFEAIVGRPAVEHPLVFRIFALSYPGRYKTERIWFRGCSKYLRIKKALDSHNVENALPELQISATFSVCDWAIAALFTLILIAVPAILAFFVSYFTPNIGLSCRSLTFLVYFVPQFLQLILWVWVLKASTICSDGILHSPMCWMRNTTWNAYRCFIWWILAALFGIASILTSIGGTIMQLLGVYRNCLCALPVQY